MIEQFKDDYKFLSNFYKFEKPLERQGISYPSVEHFYVAMKSKDDNVRQQASQTEKVKSFGKTIELRYDWEEIKDSVMLYALRYKFGKHNPTLRDKLLETGNQEIQEGNWWGDKYWGVCLKTGEGQNKLGKMLMQIREEIREEKEHQPFKVIIAGGRDFTDYSKLVTECNKLLTNYKDNLEVVCGGARGADNLGRDYAEDRDIPVKLFEADWDKYGKQAGIFRNIDMGKYSDAAIIFWDGKSRGSRHMLEYMQGLGKPVRVVKY